MSKEIKCPWCQENTSAKGKVSDNKLGRVNTRQCDKCGKVLASYLVGEGDFLPKIRVYGNE